MRYERILLVFPAFRSDTGSSRPSPSLSYVAQALEDASIEYDILDMKLGYSFNSLKNKIQIFKPDLVGFTVFTLHHKIVYGMIEQLKLMFPEIKMIVGGPHVSIEKDKVLSDCHAIDYACVHEGEELIIELCKGNSLESIRGLAYKNNGNVKFTGIRSFSNELDNYGFPRLNKFELNKYANEILIISSRGCPYSCIYCSVHLVLGKNIRLRSVENVVDELEYWHRKGRLLFNFVDDNFTFYEDRVYKICDEIEKRGLKKLILRASNGVRADRLSYSLLKRMKEVGFRSIGIGVEAGNNKVLGTLKKGETIEQIERAIKNACDLGYEVGLFFVFGTPGETLKDVEDSINIALKYPVFKVDFYNLIPFPGTELHKWVDENNAWTGNPAYLLDESDKNIRFGSRPFFETKELPYVNQIELSRKLLKVMRIVERNYLKRILKKKLGFFSYPLAYLISTSFIQKLYFNNNKLRRIAENIRYSIMK